MTPASGEALSYGELLRLTEGHGTSEIYERIQARLAEARREERLRWEPFARKIAAESTRDDHRNMAWSLLRPPASAPEGTGGEKS